MYGLELDHLPHDVDFWWKGTKEDFKKVLKDKGLDCWYCDLPTDASGLCDRFGDNWSSTTVIFKGLQVEVLALDQIFLSYKLGAIYNPDPDRRQKCINTIEQININI